MVPPILLGRHTQFDNLPDSDGSENDHDDEGDDACDSVGVN